MKLLALRIHGFGCFHDPVILEGFTGGLDVLAEANEAGKSTAFDALQTLLFTKHTSSTKHLKERRSDGTSAPLIEADLEISGRSWRIRKRFLVSKEAVLTDLDTNKIAATGADADSEIAQLLGGDQGEHQSRLLWVAQRASLDDVVPSGDEKELLQNAIEKEVSVITGGSEARAIRARAVSALEALTSLKQKRPQGDYKAALERVETLREERDLASDKAHTANERLRELEAVSLRRLELANPETRAEREEAVAETRKRLIEAKEAHDKLSSSRQLAEMKQIALAQTQNVQAGFLADEAQQKQLHKNGKKLAARLKTLEGQAKKARLALSKTRSEKQNAQKLELTARKTLAQVTTLRHQDTLRARLGEVEARAKAAQETQDEFTKCNRELAKNRASGDLMKRLSSINGSITILEGRLQAAAPHVTMTYKKGAEGKVASDGKKLIDGKPVRVLNASDFVIDTIGVLRVEAGAGEDVDENLKALAEERSERERTLSQIGARDFSGAEQLAHARQELKTKTSEASARLEALAPEGLQQLHLQLDKLRGEIDGQAIEDISNKPQSIEQAEANVVQAGAALSTCERGLEKASEDINRLEIDLATHASKQQSNEAQLEALQQRLPPSAKQDTRKKELDALVSGARDELRSAEIEVGRWQRASPKDDELDALRLRAGRAEDAKTNAESETAQLDNRLAALEGALQRDREDGIDEVLAELEGTLESAERQVEKFKLETEALELLIKTLDEVAGRERTRFLKPVMQRLEPYLNLVFPEAALSFEDGLNIGNITRQGKTEPLSHLSDGTREQIAILVRLAFAALLAQNGQSVPVILDDALVYSDDERIDRLFDALNKAAEEHQVIVLTCRTRSFDALGGNRLHFRKSAF